MAFSSKKITSWEKSEGKILTDVSKLDLDAKVSAEEFETLTNERGFTAVDYAYREQWLKDNGYERTRENFVDIDLPTVLPEE